MENVKFELLDFCINANISIIGINDDIEIEQLCDKDRFIITKVDKDNYFEIEGICTDINLEIYLICENDEFIYFITINEEYLETSDDEKLTVKK